MVGRNFEEVEMMTQKMITIYNVGGDSTEIVQPEAVEHLIGIFSKPIDEANFIHVPLEHGRTLLLNPNLITSISIQEIENRQN